jgi:hypothetical protein
MSGSSAPVITSFSTTPPDVYRTGVGRVLIPDHHRCPRPAHVALAYSPSPADQHTPSPWAITRHPGPPQADPGSTWLRRLPRVGGFGRRCVDPGSRLRSGRDDGPGAVRPRGTTWASSARGTTWGDPTAITALGRSGRVDDEGASRAGLRRLAFQRGPSRPEKRAASTVPSLASSAWPPGLSSISARPRRSAMRFMSCSNGSTIVSARRTIPT